MARSKKMSRSTTLSIPIVIGGGIVTATIAIGGLVYIADKNDSKDTNNNSDVGEGSELNLKDGTYRTEASFYVPEGDKTETIGVTVTIKDGRIESVQTDSIEEGQVVESTYMDKFNTKVKELVTGKKPQDIYSMELVSGSTLSSDGFKDALRSVEIQAKED